MERLTEKREGWAWPKKDWTYEATAECLDRLAAIEDILGDEYDLDRLRELAQADREGRVEIIEPDVYECIKVVRKAQAALRREQDGNNK